MKKSKYQGSNVNPRKSIFNYITHLETKTTHAGLASS